MVQNQWHLHSNKFTSAFGTAGFKNTVKALRHHRSCHSYVPGHIHLDGLQDAQLSLQQLSDHYLELVLLMRKMYQECRLIHADLSEYNVLVHQVCCKLKEAVHRLGCAGICPSALSRPTSCSNLCIL